MAHVEEREKTHHISSTPMSNFPRDLLQRFITVNHHQHLPFPVVKLDGEEEEEEIELSLGLSMNGRFGVDPTAKKIKRTSSIPEFVNTVRDEEVGYVVAMACGSSSSSTTTTTTTITPLIRTCSLPTETEEEWRKRKELQTLRRMEARRKRSEKQRSFKAMRERNRGGGLCEENIGSSEEGNNNLMEQGADAVAGVALNEFNYNILRRTTSLTTRVSGLGLNSGEKDNNGTGSSGGLPPPSPSQVSTGSSHGTRSSLISESECQQGQVDAARSPIGANTLPESEQKPPVGPVRNVSKNHSSPEKRTKDIVRNLLEDMPCVSTKGEGPNGKRIEGFLYRYGKGEEVRIVCVCHGSFLTPAEFVKHAGGGDVANPLKHIVVSPNYL